MDIKTCSYFLNFLFIFSFTKSDLLTTKIAFFDNNLVLLSSNIDALQSHFKKNAKDHHSRTGLIRMVAKRRKLLDYLRKSKPDVYSKLITDLGLRR